MLCATSPGEVDPETVGHAGPLWLCLWTLLWTIVKNKKRKKVEALGLHYVYASRRVPPHDIDTSAVA